jgi:hypothetical protein
MDSFKRFLAVASIIGLPGCELVVPVDNTVVVANSEAISNQNAVCDAFSGTATDYDHGIMARMAYLSDDQPRYGSARDYLTNGHPIDAALFFGNFDVPTRPFDRGFVTLGGETILNEHGNTLYEYFGLKFETVIQLPDAGAVGDYQLALLADDGALIEVDRGNGWETVVNNDGVHATKMGCATAPVTLSASQGLPVRVQYYQGPRFHISLVMLWRPWITDDATRPIADSECGRSGNSRFFDSTQTPPRPQSAYNGLLSRGWSVVPPQAFRLPSSVSSNPCGGGVGIDTTITNVAALALVTKETSISIAFDSNKPGSTFFCSRDGAASTACVSPMTYNNLADGSHTFSVYSVDANGVADSTPATHNWMIDTLGPVVLIISATVGRDYADIAWTTSEATTSEMYWGLGTLTGNFVPSTDGAFSLDHAVSLTGLTPNTVYSYRPAGFDQATNPLTASRRVMRTAP